jgi:polyisoprenoid-binding protein YceI
MKKFMIVATAGALFLASCGTTPDADKATTAEKQDAAAAAGETFAVDTNTSAITWTGAKPTGQHSGTFAITEGNLSADNGVITAGNFTINIAGINVTDLTEETGKGKLEGHLASPDFFDVTKFPTAKFEITSVEAYDSTKVTSKLEGATNVISGNLTLKDSTKNVTFPAKVSVTEAGIEAQASFNIDRTQWGLNYKGPDNPQDWVIKKEVNLVLDLKAAKK